MTMNMEDILGLAIVGADSYRDDLWVLMHPNLENCKQVSHKKLSSYRSSYNYLTEQISWMEKEIRRLKKEGRNERSA